MNLEEAILGLFWIPLYTAIFLEFWYFIKKAYHAND